MSRLLPPDGWAPRPADLERARTAGEVWARLHPRRRLPPDYDGAQERREIAWLLRLLPDNVEVVRDVAEKAFVAARKHWPTAVEIANEVRAFERRAHNPTGRSSLTPPDHRAVDAQCATILRALDLDGPEVSPLSRARAIAAAVEAVVLRLRSAIKAGDMPEQALADFRAGRAPDPATLEKIVRDIAAKGQLRTGSAVLPKVAA